MKRVYRLESLLGILRRFVVVAAVGDRIWRKLGEGMLVVKEALAVAKAELEVGLGWWTSSTTYDNIHVQEKILKQINLLMRRNLILLTVATAISLVYSSSASFYFNKLLENV